MESAEAGSSLLLPEEDDASGPLSGYLNVRGQSFALRIVPARPPAKAELHACPKLRAALRGSEAAVEQRLQRGGADSTAIAAELKDLLERLLPEQPATTLRSTTLYEAVIAELDGIGWGRLLALNEALDELSLQVQDGAGRSHTLGLSLPADYPRSPPRAAAALPAPFELQWAAAPSGGGADYSLAGAMAQFSAELARHQPLWDELDDLDANCWVLEPAHPTRDVSSRRLALGQHCSLSVALHVAAPASLPELAFLGAERVIGPLRRALNAKLHLWEPKRSVRLNLEAVLGVSFPTPQAASSEGADEYSSECAVCYTYRVDGKVPEVACDGCSKPFHTACLVEWLRAVPTTQTSFNRLYGECPYCQRPITVEAAG